MAEEPEQEDTQELKPVLTNADGTPNVDGWREIAKRLKAPMEYKERQGRGGVFAYINARQVMDRLDRVVGPANWSTRYTPMPDGAVECSLSIFGVAKADVGYRNNPEAKPGDKQFETEPLKAAYSDAFKRAAVHWGIGRFLYGDSA